VPRYDATFDENVGAARASADARGRLIVSEPLRSPLGTALPVLFLGECSWTSPSEPPESIAVDQNVGKGLCYWEDRLCSQRYEPNQC
jgi:hypothetical protein